MKVARHGIAVSNFTIDDNLRNQALEQQVPCSFIALITGDRVVVHAENEGWCFGSRIGVCEEDGLFPADAISYVDRMSQTDPLTEGASLIDEIDRVSHRWWTRVKELYSKQAEMHYLNEVLDSIDEMLAARKKILSGGVPSEELNLLRIQIARKIDRGNLLLSLGVTIRQDNGVPFDPEAISILQTYQEHLEAEKRVSSETATSLDVTFDAFCLMIEVQSIELKMKHNCEISMVLFDVERKQFISDTFSFIWKCTDTRTTTKGLNIKALFSNFARDTEQTGRRIVLISRVAQIAPIESSSSTLKKGYDQGPSSQFCRQVHAFDFLDVSHIFNHPVPSHEAKEKMIFLNREQQFDQAFKSLQVTSRVPKFNTSSDDIKLFITTQVFAGPVRDIRLKCPHLFTRCPPVIIKRTDLEYDIFDDVRNELFLTLEHGELSGKSSDRNIEARLTVVESNGEIVPDCFETTTMSGVKLTSDYRSFVFYHEDKPYWMEQIQVRLPEYTAHDLHLRITLHARKPYDKGKPDKGPFALAHICLLQNAVLMRNEDHELLVYKIESSHYDPANTTYLALPQTRKQLRELGNTNNKPHSSVFSLSEKSSVHIGSRVCSTILTQNEHVLNVLRWRTNSFHLNASLAALAAPVGETETDMIRFLCPLLDSLFEIWEEREQLELPVFDVIVSLLKLIDEPRHPRSAQVFEKYMERFPFTTAALKLIRCLNHYIASAATTNNDKTRNSLKVMGRVFSAVVSSKNSCESFDDDVSYSGRLRANLEAVLESLILLMSETRERMAVQNTALKHLPAILDPVLRSGTYEANELCLFVIRVINGFGKNIVARERLGFVAQLIETELFESSSSRLVLLPRCLDLLLLHLDPELCEQQKDYPDRALECSAIIASLIERLYPVPAPKLHSIAYGTDEELNLIISALFRPIVQAMVTVERLQGSVQATRGRFFTLILALLNKMSAQIFDHYLRNRPNFVDKMDFVLEMVQMIRDLLSKCPFAATWEHMIMLQNKSVHKALRFVMSAIQTYFSNENFRAEVWEEFMLTTVRFVTQPALQWKEEWLHDETDMRVQLRKAAAKDLRSMWFRLTTSQKMEYIPRLVGAFLEVALVEDDETREATIPIFFDMMQTEFHSSLHGNRDFKRFSDELISQLDTLVDQDCGNRAFQEQFTRILTAQCQSDKELWSGGGRELISRVDRLLAYLFEYRHVRETADCAENGMSRTVQLMRYYEKYGHDHLYITYVYKLYALHIMYHNEVEAARTLMMHANMLTWDEVELADWLVARNLNRHCATERQLKDRLLNEAADLFAQGQLWEDAIQILRELAPVYERMYVDYDKLASLMERIAELYRKIDRESRAYFYFYLVAFYGKGYPSYLNGQRFVFRSDNLEMLGDFLARMLQMYGSPSQIPTMDDSSYLLNSPARHIQVFSVDPVAGTCPFEEEDVNPYIKEYYRHYNINNFEYSRVEKRQTKWTEVADTDIMRQWTVKTRLVTHETLPGVLRFSKVMSSSAPIQISPLRLSVDQMERKNRELKEEALKVIHNPKHPVKNLSGAILGVVQANVQGGIKNYEVFFTEECAKIYEPEEKRLAMKLSALIIDQTAILEYCVHAHSIRSDRDVVLHDTLIGGFIEYRTYVEDRFGKTHSLLPPGASMYQQTVPENSHSERDKKAASNGSSFDLTGTPTGTLKSRGVSTMLNMWTSARKLTLQPSPSMTQRSSSSLLDDANRSMSFSRLNSRESLQSMSSPMRLNQRRQTNGSTIDGIRMRTTSRDSSFVAAPPLPPRPAQPRAEPTDTLDRNVLLGDKYSKPPVPTPITD